MTDPFVRNLCHFHPSMKTSLSVCAFTLAWLSASFSTLAVVRYVNVNSTNPTPPYTNWATAAAVIQDAIDVALPGNEVVVTNGVYQTGGRAVDGFLTNRVAVTKPLILRSVNGPGVTVIRGYQVPQTTNGNAAVRCVYLTNGATISGFTLTNGATATRPGANDVRPIFGGGVLCEASAVASNCVMTGNSAAGSGGGAFGGTLNNCILTGNLASRGGGASFAVLSNCVVSANYAEFGGGAEAGGLANCTVIGNRARYGGGLVPEMQWIEMAWDIPEMRVNNCILYYNTASEEGDNYLLYYFPAQQHGWIDMYDSCAPFPAWGAGNITNTPCFVDAATGNFRLQSTSPCINAGWNFYAGPDLDGNPRLVGGRVDIGAYEFQSPQSAISYAWLQQYGLPTDGSADFTDLDGDGHNNWEEWHAWTDPTNSASALRLLMPVRTTNGLLISWESVSGQAYVLERSTNIAGPFDTVIIGRGMRFPCPTDCPIHFYSDQPGTLTYRDINAVGPGPFFYRVSVRE